jgi:hypothetical protein
MLDDHVVQAREAILIVIEVVGLQVRPHALVACTIHVICNDMWCATGRHPKPSSVFKFKMGVSKNPRFAN